MTKDRFDLMQMIDAAIPLKVNLLQTEADEYQLQVMFVPNEKTKIYKYKKFTFKEVEKGADNIIVEMKKMIDATLRAYYAYKPIIFSKRNKIKGLFNE